MVGNSTRLLIHAHQRAHADVDKRVYKPRIVMTTMNTDVRLL